MTVAPPGGAARPDEDASTALSAGRYDSFVLRVFSRTHDGSLVHGEVTHIATRRKRHFTDLPTAIQFILAQVAQQTSTQDAVAEHD